MRVVVAPDSFKGSLPADEVAERLAEGWRRRRPADDLVLLPLADGGEGTLDALVRAVRGGRWSTLTVPGPDGHPVEAGWVLLPDGTAVVELARSSGLPLMRRPDPLGASTAGLGHVLADAAAHPEVRRVVVGLGGSASTDGGAGALQALGARLLDDAGETVRPGGAGLRDIARIDLDGLVAPPPGGVRCLVDVTAPLLGVDGAATVFGPQKGAGPDDVRLLEQCLRTWAGHLGGDPGGAGAGAAGGTAYGLATAWGAELVPGSAEVAELVGLPAALEGADVVVTGEGRFDAQSLRGKVVGHVLERARALRVRPLLAVGSLGAPLPPDVVAAAELVVLAGGPDAALADAGRWLRVAGAELADAVGRLGSSCGFRFTS